MTAPDDFAVRMYGNERDRHHDAARQALTLARERLDRLMDGWDTDTPIGIAADARHIMENVAEGYGRAEAWKALVDVRFLVESAAPSPEGKGQ